MSYAIKALKEARYARNVGVTVVLKNVGLDEAALVTDGRFSDATHGPYLGHICPEASDGAMTAFIESGDIINLDISNGIITADVSEDVLAQRKDGWSPVLKEVGFGYMDRYCRHVRPASEDAV